MNRPLIESTKSAAIAPTKQIAFSHGGVSGSLRIASVRSFRAGTAVLKVNWPIPSASFDSGPSDVLSVARARFLAISHSFLMPQAKRDQTPRAGAVTKSTEQPLRIGTR